MTSCCHPLVQADAVAITTAIKQRALRSDLVWGLGVIPHMHDAFRFFVAFRWMERALCVFKVNNLFPLG